jgi:hypothetical protein
MKLDKFIKENCCNYVRNECIGVWGTKRFNDADICGPLKKEEPEACWFFEEVVLPAAIHLGCHEELVDHYSKVDFGVVKRTKAVRAKEAAKPIKKRRKR